MSARRTALIVGGSLGGLFAANLLLRAGWNVAVFERVGDALAGRGAGIVTHDALFDALKRAGATIDATIGCETHSRVTLDREGRVIAELPLRQILTAWSRMYRLLKDALPPGNYHSNKTLERVEQNDDGVTACFADGTRAAGDLLIGADGFRSTVRAQFLPDAKPVYAGYVAWRGLVDEKDLSADTRRILSDRLGFCLPPGEQMLGYLVAGSSNTTTPGERRYNFVWYRPADEAVELPALLTDASGSRHDMNIPPDRIRREAIAEMRAAAQELLAPQFAEIVRATAEPFFQPIYDLESPRIVFGRVAILGDAAFVARPHVGLGVTKAAGDAVALVDAVMEQGCDLSAALRAYDASRVSFGRSIVAHARDLGLGIGNPRATGRRAELIAQMRRPEIVMREVAVPDWAERPVARSALRVA
jgi:2-polyprenyl-6-methoxyphenol hydroxylase-like FAD-dependent oxidoreductase